MINTPNKMLCVPNKQKERALGSPVMQNGRPHSTNENTTSPGSNQTQTSNSIEGLAPIDLTRRNLKFEISDFHISRRFKSFI